MKRYDNVEKMKRGILRQLQVEYDYLSPGAQRRVDSALVRTRNFVKKLDSGVQARLPSGRAQAKRIIVGGTGTITNYIDGATGGKPPSRQGGKRGGKKQKKVVGKK